MASLQENVKDVCKLADAVLDDPTTSIQITAKHLGLAFLIGGLPGVLIAWWAKAKLEQLEREEKERMLREVIGKQQAVIDRLNQELAKSRQQNKKNHREIENLKEMLRMLEEAESQLKAA